MKLKKLSLFLLSLCLFSCNQGTSSSTNNVPSVINIIAPQGTPSLGLANFYIEKNNYTTFDIKAGADALVAAFTSTNYDIIVAPTNLGAKLYNSNKKFVLYNTIVWGNLYLATTNSDINSFKDLNNKSVTLFGKNSTPDIVMKSLIKYYDINVHLKYVDDVSNANAMLKTNIVDTIVSAEPSISKIGSTINNLKIIDLQDEFSKISNKGSYPQASIFVRNEKKNELKDTLIKMKQSIIDTKNIEQTADNALLMHESFSTLGKETLIKAIPNCHFGIEDNQKDAIENYFNKMSELGLGAQFGEKLPDEEFYFSF